jgi:predicted AAA+ superfamily ATPase
MNWLVNTGLVYKTDRITDPKIPLVRYAEREYFKLYMLDVGLLAAKSFIDMSTFLTNDHYIFNEFKGALTEQYVLQELKAARRQPIVYWGNESGKAEVDFIIQHKNEIIPMEVKSSINTKSQSLKVYMEKFHPKNAIRVSLRKFGNDGTLLSVPLYMIGNIDGILRSVFHQ